MTWVLCALLLRRNAKPVLRGGAKFPAFSLHMAPSLQPLQLFTGPAAAKELTAALTDHPTNAPLSLVSQAGHLHNTHMAFPVPALAASPPPPAHTMQALWTRTP